MEPIPFEPLIRWTARGFVACYCLRLLLEVGGGQSASRRPLARSVWTLGGLLCLVHTSVALHFAHGWNQSEAYDYVRRRTFETTGWSTGIGLVVNYLFLFVWGVDLVFWWRDDAWPDRKALFWSVQGFLAFLIFQATVVFGPPFWQPLAAVLFLALGLLAWQNRRLVASTRVDRVG